jgi:hypothetical protein
MKTKHLFLSILFVFFAVNTVFAQAKQVKVSISGKSSGNITVGELIAKQLEVSKAEYTVASYVLVVKAKAILPL